MKINSIFAILKIAVGLGYTCTGRLGEPHKTSSVSSQAAGLFKFWYLNTLIQACKY